MPYHSGNELVDPYQLFDKVQMRAGMRVADFGCGRTGHIVLPAAPILGDRGIVYAVDVMKDVLAEINKRAAENNLTNIHTVWSDIERVGTTAVPENSLDIVFVVNTLWHVSNRHGLLEEARRLLKDKARVVVVDWMESSLPFAAPEDRLVNFDEIARWSELHGFVVQEAFEVGRHHGGLILFKHD